jgi:hypothetical protein
MGDARQEERRVPAGRGNTAGLLADHVIDQEFLDVGLLPGSQGLTLQSQLAGKSGVK